MNTCLISPVPPFGADLARRRKLVPFVELLRVALGIGGVELPACGLSDYHVYPAITYVHDQHEPFLLAHCIHLDYNVLQVHTD